MHLPLHRLIPSAGVASVAAAAADISERNKLNKLKDATTQNAIPISVGDSRETMNDELAKVLKLYREKSHNWDIHKTPEIFIQPTSSPASVKQWLKAKGFSDFVVTKFGYLSGNELFSLDRETLEEHCGAEEGKRLLSQITVQRNVSGVKDLLLSLLSIGNFILLYHNEVTNEFLYIVHHFVYTHSSRLFELQSY